MRKPSIVIVAKYATTAIKKLLLHENSVIERMAIAHNATDQTVKTA
ncbi:MAG: hypothetical protein QW782_09665 [Candidatus Bathyarchaeia archaeon]